MQAFIREFFDQNPLSHLGLIVLRNGVAEKLTDLSGSPVRNARQRQLLCSLRSRSLRCLQPYKHTLCWGLQL